MALWASPFVDFAWALKNDYGEQCNRKPKSKAEASEALKYFEELVKDARDGNHEAEIILRLVHRRTRVHFWYAWDGWEEPLEDYQFSEEEEKELERDFQRRLRKEFR